MDNKPMTTSNNTIPFSPEDLIAKAIEKGLPVDTMEKLLAMRKELKAEFAKEAFDAAMSKFQAECPVIEKNKSGPNNAYRYAPIEEIVRQVKKQLEENGFSYSIQTQMTNDKVKVTCIAKHKLGHSESSDVELPLATRTGLMNAPQQTAATMTYAKRYAFCNAFGIMTGDEDTDAQSIVVQSPPQNVVKAITTPVAKSSPPSTTKTCNKCGNAHNGQYATCYNCYKGITKPSPAPKEGTGELTPEEIKAYEKEWQEVAHDSYDREKL